MKWQTRSRQKEIIDEPAALTLEETERMLDELRMVNRWLGGRQLTRQVRTLIEKVAASGGPVVVADVGCGSADLAADLTEWSRRQAIRLKIYAFDLNPLVCRTAAARLGEIPEVNVVQADTFRLPLRPDSVDLVMSSALMHHFSDREIVHLFRTFRQLSREGVIISDLQRSRPAYWGISLLTRLLSRSPAVRNDGPLSVRKGFRRHELMQLLAEAGVLSFRVNWRWAFRYFVRF